MMGESTYQRELDAGDPEARRAPRASAAHSVLTPLSPPVADTTVDRVVPPYLAEALGDAENLLTYAAEEGVAIPVEVRGSVLAARQAAAGGWTDQNALNLLGALTSLAAKLKPVSGESLRVCAVDELASKTIFWLRLGAIGLATIIVPFSVLAFVALGTCESIHKGIEQANELAVTLARLPPRAGAIAAAGANVREYSDGEVRELQQFAAAIRAIDRDATQLRRFGFLKVEDPSADWPKRLELPPPSGLNVEREVSDKIGVYQEVRSFAQSVQESVQITFGAVTSCVLPMLYALLGACAFLIRSFEDQRRKRTFTRHGQLPARMLIAAIGGLVVGLFGNFGDGHTHGLSPLAVAFMVGYAVDVFFYFIDGLLQTFARPRSEAATRGPANSG